jgi:hypothetical protein
MLEFLNLINGTASHESDVLFLKIKIGAWKDSSDSSRDF